MQYHFRKKNQQEKSKDMSFRDHTFYNTHKSKEQPERQIIAKTEENLYLPPLQSENKELYLQYMEEVLRKKEQQLIEREQIIIEESRNFEMAMAEKKLINPLHETLQSQLTVQKVNEVIKILERSHLNNEHKQIIRSLQEIEYRSNRTLQIAKEELKAEYEEFIKDKNILHQKLSKLGELQSYENYLNQLQEVLQNREKNLEQAENQFMNRRYVSKDSKQYIIVDQNSQKTATKKRHKIFDGKFFQMNSESQQSSIKPIEQCSSDHIKFKQIEYVPKMITKEKELVLEEKMIQIDDMGTQTDVAVSVGKEVKEIQEVKEENKPKDVWDFKIKMRQEMLILKYLKMWLKRSAKLQKSTPAHKKLMALYLWRTNSLFDESIPTKVFTTLHSCKNLGIAPNFTYKELSLRKKKYAEQFLDLERKIYNRKYLVNLLKGVVKNKVRKERLVVVLAFKQWFFNGVYKEFCKNFRPKGNQKEALGQTFHNRSNMEGQKKQKNQVESRLISLSSSKIMNENRVNNLQNHHLKSSINKTVNNSLRGTINNSTNSLQNKSRSKVKEDNIDMLKLRQYIKSQEQTEFRLMDQCAKTQSTFKMASALSSILNKQVNGSVLKIMRETQNKSLLNLTKNINACEFKWQLFITKAKLAITNTNNKIGQLQQMMSLLYGQR